eukprot:1140262-Pelagomonas_calceolata.AAC.2
MSVEDVSPAAGQPESRGCRPNSCNSRTGDAWKCMDIFCVTQSHRLAQSSGLSGQTTWLNVKSHCNLKKKANFPKEPTW